MSWVLENDAITFEGENGGRITEAFFEDDNFNVQRKKIGNLKVSDIIKDGGVVRYNVFSARTNIRINEEKYERLSRICLNRVEEVGEARVKPVDLITFCNRFRKRSKSFRRILTGLCRWFRFAQLAKGKKSRP